MALIRICSFLIVVLVFQFGPLDALAQIAPSPSELSSYSDLHRAAHEGDIDALTALIKNDSDLDVRDGSGRTPVIIAAFASHDRVVKILLTANFQILHS